MSADDSKLSRRRLLGGAAGTAAAMPLVHALVPHQGLHEAAGATHERTHRGPHGNVGAVGRVDPRVNGFDPALLVRDFDRGKVRREGGRVVREFKLVAQDKEIEVAPGVKYAAWTYNGRVPGPTLRATEGDRIRVRFINGSAHSHTVHFHGIHRDVMDGVPGIGPGNLGPGQEFTYEFDAEPFGLHLYHCHSMPLADHIAKGLYGAFVIDPKESRAPADELVMVMNGFDTNFDRENEIYAVNSVAFAYHDRPIRVKRGELVRMYIVNTLEFDLLNSFHLHANFFDWYPTGTKREARDFTDTVTLGQGERGIAEVRFPFAGKYMFHAHVSEFAELGWMGFIEVMD